MTTTKRSMATLVLAAGLTLPLLGTVTGCATGGEKSAAAEKYRLLMQVSDADPGKWNLTLNNARNVQNHLGKDNVDVEIVVYGPGIHMLKADSKVEPRVTAAMSDGVRVVACETTMKAMKISRADLTPSIGYVPGGLIEIMDRQREGWYYVRP